MRKTSLAVMIGSGLVLGAPAPAQDGFGDIISGVAKGLLVQELDRAAYEEARQTNTLRGWRAYLEKYPDGAYRLQAERAIARLGGTVTVPDPVPGTGAAIVEARLGLSRDQRRLIRQPQIAAQPEDDGGCQPSTVQVWPLASSLPRSALLPARAWVSWPSNSAS